MCYLLVSFVSGTVSQTFPDFYDLDNFGDNKLIILYLAHQFGFFEASSQLDSGDASGPKYQWKSCSVPFAASYQAS